MARDTPLGFPAHTLHPQGVCSIRKAAEPLTAAPPSPLREFTPLSTVSKEDTMSDSNKALKEKLLSSRKNGFDRVDAAELEQLKAVPQVLGVIYYEKEDD